MGAPKRILVAEDERDLLELYRAYLVTLGYEVMTATDGGEAVAMAKAGHVDLAVVDVMLPGLDGYHVALELSKLQAPRPPRIIIVSCRDMKREGGLAVQSGASHVMEKPLHFPTLGAKIAELLAASPA